MLKKKPTGGSGSVVTASSNNGKVKVDNVDVTVYDDAALVTSIDTKAASTHSHTLANLTDFDATNKTNGYAFIYDSTTGKYVSKALPSGSGAGVTSMSGLSDVDVTTLAPASGNFLSFDNGKWKPVTGATNKSSYFIDLAAYGITQGIPAKPYQYSNYVAADNNIKGINNAIKYAYDNAYTEVILPRGQYALCYNYANVTAGNYNWKVINMKDNLTFNLNGSTLKVIYDSDVRSPFDTKGRPNPVIPDIPLTFEGTVMEFNNVHNAQLINGEIIGDRADRSYTNPAEERKLESSTGIRLLRTSSHNSIRNCRIGAFTGDSINFLSDAISELIEFSPLFTLNDVDNANGSLIASTNTITSGLFVLPTLDAPYSSLLIAGSGYSRTISGMASKDFHMAFYKADGTFIGKMKYQKIYTPVSIPKGSAKFRIIFLNETDINKSFPMRILYGDIPHHNVVSHCDIYGCQRGGIQGGGSHNIIEYNSIRDTGKSGNNSFLDGGTVFGDPTRYGINQEDSFGDGVIIRHNHFYGGTNGILAGVYSITVENNHFYNLEGCAVNLYTTQFAHVTGNYVYNCQTAFGLMDTNLSHAFINITGNYVRGGGSSLSQLGLSGVRYRVNFSENYIVDVPIISMSTETATFRNNTIKYTTSAGGSITVDKVKDCVFETNLVTSPRIDARIYEYEGCTFDNIMMSLKTRNDNTVIEKVNVDRCVFKNNAQLYSDTTVGTNPRIISVTKSKFIDSIINFYVVNMSNATIPITLKDCIFEFNSGIVTSGANTPTTMINLYCNTDQNLITFDFESCTVNIKNTLFTTLLSCSPWGKRVYLSFRKCDFNYSGQTPLVLTYYQQLSAMGKFVSTKNTFNNITLPSEDAIFIGYDEMEKTKNGEPTTYYYYSGDIRNNVSLIAGGYVGYVCLTEGYATANRQWSAKTLFIYGDRIFDGTHVYEVNIGGISTATKPALPTTGNGTVKDNVGVTSWQASHVYTVGDFIVPLTSALVSQSHFGYYFECTVTGNSGTTEPIWQSSGTISDGIDTLKWQPRIMVTWKRLGNKATFKPYGLISI